MGTERNHPLIALKPTPYTPLSHRKKACTEIGVHVLPLSAEGNLGCICFLIVAQIKNQPKHPFYRKTIFAHNPVKEQAKRENCIC